jgi:hypothetical protein
METHSRVTIPNLVPSQAFPGANTSVELSPRSVPSEMRTQVLLGMRGWLMKRKMGVFDRSNNKAAFSSIFGDFNRRFFWLDPSIRLIYYSESEDKSKRVSFIPFNRIVSVTPVTDPVAINSAKTGWVYGLELQTLDRVYELWARTPAEAKQWLAVLEKAASIGKNASNTSMYSVNSSTESATAYNLDPLQTSINVGNSMSRRGSAAPAAGGQNEEPNTVVLRGAPTAKIVSPMSDNVTVDIATTLRSPPIKLAPTKWDEWGK